MNTTTITLQILMLNDLLNNNVIEQILYDNAIQKITNPIEVTIEEPILATPA